jgi:uncharacterized protein with von Willebrand factor type A (vWA) domain
MEAAETLAARRIAAFAATLRDAGFAIGVAETLDAARIVASPLALRPASLRPALRALVCGNRSDWQRFDALFDAAFLGRRLRNVVRSFGTVPSRGPRSLRELAAGRAEQRAHAAPEAAAGGDDMAETSAAMREGASLTEAQSARDLREIADPAALDAAEQAAERVLQALRARRSRRQQRHRRGRRLDLRRTIRASLSHGGTPLDLAWKRPRRKRLRVALLLDVSGSMSVYTPMSVRFAMGMLRGSANAEAFMFHTRLVEISAALRERDRVRALDQLTLLARGVGGGTRIGESFAAFNRAHAPRALSGRSVCFIMSDGYETGDAAHLGREMAALRRRCRKIVWLNPLANSPEYQPTARGMQAAMPHLQVFAPAGTPQNLQALVPLLDRL